MAGEYRFYQTSAEVLHSGVSTLTVAFYQLSAEVLHSAEDSSTAAAFYQTSIEVLHSGAGTPIDKANFYQASVEVLRAIPQGFFPSLLDEGDTAFALEFVPDVNLAFLDEGDTVYPPSLTLVILVAFYDPFISDELEIFQLRFEEVESRSPETIPYEWNPFRPDVPIRLVDQDPELYDYLRDQAELIRDQHNKTQAGDTTFPWQMLTTAGDRQVHTLGSVSRFEHPDYGLMLGRYVQFSDNWERVDNPVVGHDKTRNDWVGTNIEAKTDLFRVIGFASPYLLAIEELYGWCLTHGRGPFPLVVESDTEPQQFQRITWSLELNGLGLVGAGPQVAILLATDYNEALQSDSSSYSPKRWTIPAGDWFAQVEGVTPEYLVATATIGLADLESRVDDLEASIVTDYSAQILSLQTGLTNLTNQLGMESTTRAATDSSHGTRITALEAVAFGGYVTNAVFDAVELRVDALEASFAGLNSTLSTYTVNTNARLDSLESWRTTAISQIDGLTIAIADFLDPTAAEISFAPAGAIAALTVQLAIEELDTEKASLAGATFAGDISVPDEAYGVGWNGSAEVPTKNAIYDKIEDILDGVTFTGDIVVPDEAYDATNWNGSLEVPTKNAIRDKIEALSAGSEGGHVNPFASMSANTGNFGSRGGRFTAESAWTFVDVIFNHDVEATATYQAHLVTLNGTDVVQTIVASSTVRTAGVDLTVNGTATYNRYRFASTYTLTPGTIYGVLLCRGVIAGNASFDMSGTSASQVVPDADYQVVANYIRGTFNTVAVAQDYDTGANSYWMAMRVIKAA